MPSITNTFYMYNKECKEKKLIKHRDEHSAC